MLKIYIISKPWLKVDNKGAFHPYFNIYLLILNGDVKYTSKHQHDQWCEQKLWLSFSKQNVSYLTYFHRLRHVKGEGDPRWNKDNLPDLSAVMWHCPLLVLPSKDTEGLQQLGSQRDNITIYCPPRRAVRVLYKNKYR